MKFRKLLSFAAAAATTLTILPSGIPNALAAYGVGHYRMLDFNDSVSNNAATFKGEWAGAEFAKQNADGAGEVNFDAEGGVFGKDISDKCMHIWNNPQKAYTTNENYQFLWLGDNDTTKPTLSAGAWEKLSFDFAYDGAWATKLIEGMYCDSIGNNYSGTYQYKNAESLMKINGSGAIAMFNQWIDNQKIFFEKGKWYDVDIVLHAADSTSADEWGRKNYYKLYINNEFICRNEFAPKTAKGKSYDVFSGFSGFWIGEYIYETNGKQTDGMYAQKDTYFDNISLITVPSDSEPPVYTESFKNDMNTPTADGSVYGATIDASRKKTSYSYIGGLGGKETGDLAYVLKTENYEGEVSENNPFLYMYKADGVSAANGGMNYGAWQNSINWEASILLKDFNCTGARAEFVLRAEYEKSGTYRDYIPFQIYPDGNIVSGGVTVGKAVQNRWTRVGVSMNQTGRRADVYIDGKHVSTTALPSNLRKITIFKMQTAFPAVPSGSTYSGTVAYDNIRCYVGDYDDVRSNMNTVSMNEKEAYKSRIRIDNENNKILIKGSAAASEITNAVDVKNGQTLSFYTDGTYSQKAADITDGTQAVLTDGTVYRYYSVESIKTEDYTAGNFAVYMNNIRLDGHYSSGTLTSAADFTCYTDNLPNLRVLAVQYADGKIKSAAVSNALTVKGEADSFSGTKCRISADLAVSDDSNTSVKAFLWDMDTMCPVTDAIELEPFTKGQISSVIKRYLGYSNKAVTFSFDDGRPEDAELIKMFDAYGVRGTFNLNSDLQLLSVQTDERKAYVKELYKNQEVASHVKSHPHLGLPGKPADNSYSTAEEYIKLIDDGITELEEITGKKVQGMAWPYENPTLVESSSMEEAAKIDAYVKGNDYIKYARGGATNGSFDVPKSFKDWNFTCHYKAIPQYSEAFLAIPDSEEELKLFSIWGHTYEFDQTTPSTWNYIEDLLKEITEKNIWIPTNSEYADYINALNSLQYSDTSITNPSDADVYLLVNYKPVKIAANSTYTYYTDAEAEYPTIYLAGDSTCEIVDEELFPRTGWGMKLGDYLLPEITVSNQAKASRSTKTFIAEGRLDNIMSTIKPGDYLFVQFGHNDSMSGTDRYTTVDEYTANLKTFIEKAREKEANIVFLTSIRLCIFSDGVVADDSIDKYRNAMTELGKAENIPVIDVGAAEREYMDSIGEEESQKLYMVNGAAEGYTGTTDTTHLCRAGASKVAELIAEKIKNTNSMGVVTQYVK